MRTNIKAVGFSSGRRTYSVVVKGSEAGTIRYLKKDDQYYSDCYGAPHWALLHATGRIDRFDSLREAKDDALKLL